MSQVPAEGHHADQDSGETQREPEGNQLPMQRVPQKKAYEEEKGYEGRALLTRLDRRRPFSCGGIR